MKYSELDDKAKACAQQWWSECASQDFGSDEFTLTDILVVLGHLGFDTIKEDVSWSGFCSQGDGLVFKGGWRASCVDTAALLEHAPEDTELRSIAAEIMVVMLRHPAGAVKLGLNRYGCGLPIMDIEASGTGVIDDDTGEEVQFSYEEDADFRALAKRLAAWAYSQLEDEYNYVTSTEQADETLANMDGDYEFDMSGAVV